LAHIITQNNNTRRLAAQGLLPGHAKQIIISNKCSRKKKGGIYGTFLCENIKQINRQTDKER
jgi:hypothetical protein